MGGRAESHHGGHYTVENARLYTLPEELPPIIVAAAGPQATEMAGRIGDGLFGLVPDPEVIEQFEKAAGRGKPRFGQLHVCWAPRRRRRRRRRCEWWPNAAVSGNLNWELPLPSHFEERIGVGRMRMRWPRASSAGPTPNATSRGSREFIDAGYDNVYFHQVGPDQEGFFSSPSGATAGPSRRFVEHDRLRPRGALALNRCCAFGVAHLVAPERAGAGSIDRDARRPPT